ncbi:unnamed protein product, partial [Mesorhabditis spiculigera]
MNFEITFSGVRTWLEMAGHSLTDIELFRLLLSPEQLTESNESEILPNRLSMNEEVDMPVADTDEPMYQLLLRILQYKTIHEQPYQFGSTLGELRLIEEEEDNLLLEYLDSADNKLAQFARGYMLEVISLVYNSENEELMNLLPKSLEVHHKVKTS